MPAAIPAVIGLAAGYGATAGLTGLVIGGITIGATAASIIGGIIGLGISYGLGQLLTPKPKSTAADAQDRQQLIRSAIAPRQMVYGFAKVSGPLVYAGSSGADQRYLHLVVPVATHMVHSIDAVWVGDTRIPSSDIDGSGNVTAGDLAGLVRIKRHLGDQTTADSDLVAESPDGWSSNHKLLGIAYIYVRLQYNQDKFSGGFSNIAAEIRGKSDIYDPRTATTGYSENWALCVLDYLRSTYGLACADDEIDFDAFIAAANLSDEAVQLDAGATLFQPRYQMHGTVQLDAKPIDIIDAMMTAGAGWLVYVQGMYRLYGGQFTSASDSIGVSDLAGSIKLVTKPALNDVFNAVKGTFTNPSNAWQASEYPAIADSAAATEDGEVIYQELNLGFTIDPTMAQRLARIYLRRGRAGIAVQVPVRYAGIRWTVGQMLAATVADFGWSAKAMRITSWHFDPATAAVSLSLREENSSIYAWTYDAAATMPTSPDTTLIDPLVIGAPSSVAVSASTALASDGTTIGALTVTWTNPSHAFVTATEVQWQLDGASAWNSAQVPIPTARYTISPVRNGDLYHVRVRALASLVRSAWSSTSNGTGAADTTAPGVPSGFAGVGVSRGAALHWTNPTDVDLARVEVWEYVSGAWSKAADTLGTALTRSDMAAGETRSFKLRAVDWTGNASSYTSSISVTASLVVAADVTSGALHNPTTASFTSSISVDRSAAPTGSYTHAVLGGLDVTVLADGTLLVVVETRGATASSGVVSGEVVDGHDTGGPG